MKNLGSLPYEISEFAKNLAILPWFFVCLVMAAITGQLDCQKQQS